MCILSLPLVCLLHPCAAFYSAVAVLGLARLHNSMVSFSNKMSLLSLSLTTEDLTIEEF